MHIYTHMHTYYIQVHIHAHPVEKDAASENLEKQYRKMHYLDILHIIIRDGKDGEKERQLNMTTGQIRQNKKLRDEENAPLIYSWSVLQRGAKRARGQVILCLASYTPHYVYMYV